MRVVTDNSIRPLSAASVVTVGNFDGVHLGHKALLNRCVALAGNDGLDVVVITFEPLPRVYFAPANSQSRLCGNEQKMALFEQSGVDLVWLMRFNQQLAEMPAESFARDVLSGALAARHVVVGDDFRFGRSRSGDLELLTGLGSELGFEVHTVSQVEIGGARVSSTAIREALAAGDFDLAERHLGRRFTMQGEVIRGSRLGRKLGYPTANMRPEAEPSPLSGVFAVRVRIAGQESWQDGVANLGTRPVIDGKDFLVEVHLFDYSGDLYGERLEVDFAARIRDEEDFEDIEDLVEQMRLDEARAREILRG